MTKPLYFLSTTIFISSCSSAFELDVNEVEDFIVDHFTSGNESAEKAVIAMSNNIGDSVMLYNLANGWVGRPEWVNDKSKIQSDWFYEDSTVVEVSDVEVFGNVASVYGNATWYMSGEKTSRAGFHSVVGRQMGELVFKRHSWMDWNINSASNSFVWPSTEVEGALSMFNNMRYAMANLRNNDALAYSDSLVELDPELAVAHLGKFHYLFLNGKADEIISLMDEIKPKLAAASLAEKYCLETYIPDLNRAERLVKYEKALLYAGNDPLLRGWYAYFLEDMEEKIENVKIGLKRFPESSLLNNMMGYLMKDKGDFDAAKNHIQIYMTAHPDEPNAYDSMGDVLLASGDTSQAKEMFMKAYELSRNLSTGPEDFFKTSKEKADALD